MTPTEREGWQHFLAAKRAGFTPPTGPWALRSVRISHADTRASGRVPDEEEGAIGGS